MIQYFPIVTGSLTVLGNINVSGSITTSGSITISGSITSASFATSASNATNAISASYANNLTVAGTLTAQTIVVQTITSSVDYITGSSINGSKITDTHQFTGSLYVTGAFYVTTGSVGIGTTSPPTKLHVAGYGSSGTGGYSSQGIPSLGFANSSSIALFTNGDVNYGTLFGTVNTGNGWIQQQRVDGTATAYNLLLQPNGGNVGIGISTVYSGAKLHILGGLLAVEPTNGNTNSEILLGRGLSSLGTSAGSGVTAKVNFAFEGSNDNFYQEVGFITTTANQTRVNSAADFYVSTKAAGASSPSEKFRITSGGNIGINDNSPTSNNNNTSSPVLSLKSTTAGAYPSFVTKYINGAEGGMTLAGDLYIDIGGNSTSTNNNIIFRTTNTNSNYSVTEKLRITSAGNLNFNTAGSGAAYVQLNQATGQDGGILWLRNNSTKYQQALDNSDNMVFYSYAISNNAYKINSNGSATLYGALTQNASDRRLKNNITNIPNALDKIKTLNGVTFNWENNIFKTERTNDIGVIAQEVQSVLPDAVTLAPFDIDSEGNSKSGENYLTVYYEKLIPLLIEGIKELNTKFEEYKATHP